MSKRLLLTIPEKMHEALMDEMKARMLSNVQEVTRQIVSEHLRYETNKFPEEPVTGVSEKEARTCEEVSKKKVQSMLHPYMSLTDVLGETYDVRDVVQLLVRLWTRIGAVFGFSPESHLSEDEKKNLITFLEDDDPSHTRMRLVVGGLQELIRKDGINELQPILRTAMGIIIQNVWHISRMSRKICRT